MSRKKFPVAASLLVVLALVGAACSSKKGNEPSGTGGKAGGVFRQQTDSFEWTGGLDPTGEYLGYAFEYFGALHRTLLGYNHKDGKNGGNTVIADAATDLGQVSADGKTYTFKIRSGIKFQPPLNRAVTSKDYLNAFKRLANPTFNATGYPSYYQTTIAGFDEFSKNKATSISGITTPDDSTIVFQLTKPTGDFRFRVAMPAAAPMPEEVTKCITKAGDYGRYQMATGPYMIEGSDKIDISACDKLLKSPASGFDPTDHLTIVRNPNYDAGTDSKEARENFVNSITLTKNTNTDDIFKRIEEGSVDTGVANPPAPVIQKGLNAADPFHNQFHLDPGDRTWYIFMNLALAPFDDVHVRKAANFVMDKAGLVRVRGGTAAGVVAEHIVPPDVLGGRLKIGEYDPYASQGHAGDAAKAMDEMKQSKYDKNHDGKCDESSECKNVLFVTRSTPIYRDMAPIIEASFKKIGITLATRNVDSFYKAVQVTPQTPPLGGGAGWGKDYADASTFFDPLLSAAAITKDATQNYSMLGLTKDNAKAYGVKAVTDAIPSADGDIAACDAKLGDDRANCWADLDKKMMTDYLPWIPYLWANNQTAVSAAVTNYTYDQFAGNVSFLHISIDTTKQKTS